MNDYDNRSYNILRRLKVISLLNAMLIFKDDGFTGIKKKMESRKEYKKLQLEGEQVNTNSSEKSSYEEIKNFLSSIELEKNAVDIVFGSKIDIEEYLTQLENAKFKYNVFKIGEENKKEAKYYEFTRETFKEFFKSRAFIFVSNKQVSLDDFFYGFFVKCDEFDVKEIDKMLSIIESLKLIANYNDKNNISVRTETFFDKKGTNYYSGGAERYLVDLYDVAKDLNLNLNIYQFSDLPFFRKYKGINVIGTSVKGFPFIYTNEYFESQSKEYIAQAGPLSVLHIYSAFLEAYPHFIGPSIGISHGVAWDYPECKTENGDDFWARNERIIKSANNCDKMVSVDTNTANWFQTIDYELGNQKIKVIPNYVDTEEFKPDNKKHDNDKIVITYPRRLYAPRGMYLLLDIVDDLFEKYKNVEIHFVGKGFDDDINAIKKKIEKYPDRLFCYSKSPDEMHEVYKKSDISLVPTLHSEGTSLSCLEAMSTGNIVVVTRIGGLTDLIINGYNGYMVEPTKEDVLSTLENIIDNYDKQDIIRKRARESATLFNKKKWAEKWRDVIASFEIDKSSKNIELVEFYVKDAHNISEKIIDKIKEEILKNRLVYIRSEKEVLEDNISCGLLQLVPITDEIASEAVYIYVEEGIKIDRKEKIINI